jgi:sugar phosphate isomerase/epimerase
MTLAFSTLGCPDWNLPTIASKARQHGLDSVELRGGKAGHISPQLSSSQRSEVRGLFDDSGLSISCITAYTHLSTPDAQKRREDAEELQQYVDLAVDFNCPNVRTFFGAFPESHQPDEVYDYAAEMLTGLVPTLTKVRILVETHDAVSASAKLKPLLDRVESPRIGALWDMAHSHREGESLEYSWGLIGSRVHHVHVKDEYFDDAGRQIHCIPGEGIVPLEECRDLLQKQGYGGAVSLEWEKAHHPEMPDLERALPALVRIFRGGRE